MAAWTGMVVGVWGGPLARAAGATVAAERAAQVVVAMGPPAVQAGQTGPEQQAALMGRAQAAPTAAAVGALGGPLGCAEDVKVAGGRAAQTAAAADALDGPLGCAAGGTGGEV
mmetsp:Transcript_42928/g.107087  ORF Transcript_42928/g.107087 Transcript_42928/m.107087 type:complete len:113 (-) Transcript_42928:477-815(-)